MVWKRKQREDTTKLVNGTGEAITLVPVSATGLRSTEITLAPKGEYIRRKRSDTYGMYEVYRRMNEFTKIIINSDDLLKNKELTVTNNLPPPPRNAAPSHDMNFAVVKVPRASST